MNDVMSKEIKLSSDATEADVIVIGAGFAGLTAARDLAREGRRAIVLEGRERVGGRTWYRKYAGSDQGIEIGGTWFSTDWMHALRDEVERYGIELVDQPAPSNFAWATGEAVRSTSPIPAEEFAVAEQALTALHAAMQRTPGGQLVEGEDYTDLDVPVNMWPPFVSLPAASQGVVYGFAAMYAGCSPSEVSVLHFTRMMAEFGNSVTSLYDGLAQKFAHGTISLAEALQNDLPGEVHLGTRVLNITDHGDFVTVGTNQGNYSAKRVICTVPINTLHRIIFSPALPEPVRAAADVGHSCKSIKSWSRCRNVPEGLFGLGWGGAAQWVSNEYPQPDGSTIVCAFGYDSEVFDASSRESVEAALRQYDPEISVLSVDTHSWTEDEFADGAWSIWDPKWVVDGHATAFLAPHGNVFFAGSDVAESWPGWIDGAIHSGAANAARVCASLRKTD